MSFKGEVTGASELSQAFKDLNENIKRGAMDKAFAKGAIPLYNAMRANVKNSEKGVHYKGNAKGKGGGIRAGHASGNLKASIKILPYANKGGMFPTYWVKPVKNNGDPDGWYAKFVEYGHFAKVGSTGRIKISKATKRARRIKVDDKVTWVPAHPFIRPAYDSHGGISSDIIRKEILEEIEKYIVGEA